MVSDEIILSWTSGLHVGVTDAFARGPKITWSKLISLGASLTSRLSSVSWVSPTDACLQPLVDLSSRRNRKFGDLFGNDI